MLDERWIKMFVYNKEAAPISVIVSRNRRVRLTAQWQTGNLYARPSIYNVSTQARNVHWYLDQLL